jgi:hypothetical protein
MIWFLIFIFLLFVGVEHLIKIGRLTLTKIQLDQNNRMVRLGVGLHDGKWFARIDLWFVGFRLTK